MKKLAILTTLCCLWVSARAQESVTQQTNAASLKFYQINTPHFQILYPEGFDVQAQRMANTLDRIHGPESRTMGVSPKKIPLILQNQSAISNAFVTLAPRRSEFYTMPSQNYNFVGNNDWLNLLASHEYRHVVQFQRSLTGFNKFFYYIFGQQAVAAFAGAAAPQWFWEGDVVATETAFTHAGRGRIPNFNLLFRTNFLEGRTFNYHKQYLRSYRNNIPNHYVLGYHMVSYLRKKTNDPMIWEKIAHRAWSKPFIPFTFSNAIKKETGMYVKDLYEAMAVSLTHQWKQEVDALALTPKTTVTPRASESYTDYLYPQVLPDGSILAQKSGLDDIEKLVTIANGEETKKFVQGIVNESGMMSAAVSRVVWNEYRFDPRWQVRTYSVIKGIDLATRQEKEIGSASRYAGAALSPDAQRLVTVETGTDYATRIVILNYESGAVIKTLPNPANDFFSMVRFSPDGNSLIALNTNSSGKTISSINPETGEVVNLIPRGSENIGNPIVTGKYILYNSPYSNIDNLYALDTETGKRFQVTCSRYGAYNPAISGDGKTIFYNDQTRDGMDVVKMPFDPASWKPLEDVKIAPGTYEHLVTQEGRPGLLDSVPDNKYEVKRYHRASGMINPHSWGPYFLNSLAQAQVGVYSQDVLSTTSVNAGYQYDINERTGSIQAGVSYQGAYPIVDFNILSGNRTDKTSVGGYDTDYNVKLDWKETGTSLGLRLPLIFTRSKYYSQMEVGNTIGLTHVSSFVNRVTSGNTVVQQSDSRFVPLTILVDSANQTIVRPAEYLLGTRVGPGNLLSNYFHATFFHALKLSYRDFNPQFGQYLYFDYFSTPFGGDYKGSLWALRGLTFFPGVAKHHSLFFKGAYQNAPSSADFNNYAFRNQIFKPRGYAYPTDNTFTTLSANYTMPLWYPDIALGPILNIQRVKTNFFFDYGQGQHTNYFYDAVRPVYYTGQGKAQYKSIGAELTFDVNIMRLLQQIELGVRVTHINANVYNNSGLVIEFLVGNIPF